MLDLEAIEKRAEGATKDVILEREQDQIAVLIKAPSIGSRVIAGVYPNHGNQEADADFIVNAFTDIPLLIAEVRRSQAERPTGNAMLDLDAIEKRTEVVGTIILPNGEQVPLENFIESLQIPLLIAEVKRLRGENEDLRESGNDT